MTEQAPIKISNILSEKAMIARLSTSGWSGRITDKIVTEELIRNKNAQKDAATVTKALINKEYLKKIREIVSGMKKYHNEQTLPWDNNGGRLLPSTKFNEYTMKFRESQRNLNSAVTEFLRDYPVYIAEAEERLGDLFVQDDYPNVDEIKDKFELDSVFEKVPEAGDFRVDIPEHEQQKIREQIEGRVEEQHVQAMKRIWNRIFKAVEHMNKRLSEENGIFRDTLVGNIEQLVEVLPALNIMEDPVLSDMTQELRNSLCNYTPDELRRNKVLRQEMAEKSKEVMDKISRVGDIFGTPPEGPEDQENSSELENDSEVEIITPEEQSPEIQETSIDNPVSEGNEELFSETEVKTRAA